MSRNKKHTRGNIHKYRGLTLHSNLELEVIKALYRDRRSLKKTFKFSYESEVLDYTINGKYTPDYILEIEHSDQKIYVECKGYLDEVSKRKMLAVRRCHPDKDIRILFEKNNKIRRNSKMRYTDWALINGFNDVSVGREIPVEWLIGEKVIKDKNE